MKPSRASDPPTVPGFSAFGRRLEAMPEFLLATARNHGPIVRFRSPFASFYLIDDPDLIEDFFVGSGPSFMKARGTQRLSRLLGRGLLTANQPEHLVHRRMVQPAFHRKRIDACVSTIVAVARSQASGWATGSVVEIDRETSRIALEIVAKALFGTDLSRDVDEISEALDSILSGFPASLVPFSEWFDRVPLPVNVRFEASKAKLDAIVYRMMRGHRASGDDSGDLLSMLLATRDDENGGGMTDEQIRDEAMTILLAGHETTANAMAWTFYLLQRHPEIADRMYALVDDVLGDRDATLEDVPRLDYVHAVLSEAMRLYPPAWVVARRAIERTSIGRYPIKRGDIVIASQYVTHRNPRFFPDPDRFDPDRFLGRTYPKFAYFPFGGGNRLCIGERFAWTEGVVAIATIAQRVRFEALDDESIGTVPYVTLRPAKPIRARVTARDRIAGAGIR
jgi:cytochrome P450